MYDCIDLLLRQDPAKFSLQIRNSSDLYWDHLLVLRMSSPRSMEVVDCFQLICVLL